MRLEGKTAIITGAASGIGLATASRFAAEGARVAAIDLDEGQLRAKLPPGVLAVGADVADEGAVAAAVSRVRERFGHLDVLAHYAGITRDAMSWKMELGAWEDVLRVNLTGTFLVARAVAAAMREQGKGGSIVLTSSRSYLGNIDKRTTQQARAAS